MDHCRIIYIILIVAVDCIQRKSFHLLILNGKPIFNFNKANFDSWFTLYLLAVNEFDIARRNIK